MARVEDWFGEFLTRYTERFPRGDWPPGDSGFWADFKSLLIRRGVSEQDAYDASELLFEDAPDFVGDHPKALLEKVGQVWKAARAQTLPIRPEADSELAGNAAWNARAEANWLRLESDEQAVWLDLAAERLPWPKGSLANLLLAKAWAYDPSYVVSPPAPVAPAPDRDRRVRRAFDGIQPPTPEVY